jgi:hypothetical protein
VRNTFFIAALAALLSSTSFGGQILVNGDFATPPAGFSWIQTGTVQINNMYSSANNACCPPGIGVPPGGTGNRGAWNVSNGGEQEGFIQQHVAVTPGVYMFHGEAWARVYDSGGTTNSRIRLRTMVDQGQPSAFNQGFQNLATGSGGWTPWTRMSTSTLTMQVNHTIGLYMELRSNGVSSTGGNEFWGQTAADDLLLDAVLLHAPTVDNAEYNNVNASVSGLLEHQFTATDPEGGPITWSNLEFVGYTPDYGGAGPGPVNSPSLLGSGEFSWNSVGSPRGIYEWRVTATDSTVRTDTPVVGLSSTGTIKVHVTAVPEPASVALCGLAVLAMVGIRRLRS